MTPVLYAYVYANENDPFDVVFRMINGSRSPINALINIDFYYNKKKLCFSQDSYSAKEYWNVPPGKEFETGGHFHILFMLYENSVITEEEYNLFKNKNRAYIVELINLNPNIREIFSNKKLRIYINSFSKNLYQNHTYTESAFDLDFIRMQWISVNTSPVPFWDYNKIPWWANKLMKS